MTWYRNLKIAEKPIWQVSYRSRSVCDMLYALYELTYKYQTIQNYEFKGHQKRLTNIKANLEKSARKVIADFQELLNPVFEKWLGSHAIVNAKQWAEVRVNEWNEIGANVEDYVDLIKGECSPGFHDLSSVDISKEIFRLDEPIKLGKAPELHNLMTNVKNSFIESRVEDLIYQSQQEGEEKDYEKALEQATNEYEDISFSDYFRDFYGDNLEEFLKDVSKTYYMENIYTEFAEFLCFPIWYGYWKALGIDQTRQRIEKAYQSLQSVNNLPINQSFAVMNSIIGVCHQTGDMTDYISDVSSDYGKEIQRTMNILSNNPDLTEWDADLARIGLNIAAKPAPQNGNDENKKQ